MLPGERAACGLELSKVVQGRPFSGQCQQVRPRLFGWWARLSDRRALLRPAVYVDVGAGDRHPLHQEWRSEFLRLPCRLDGLGRSHRRNEVAVVTDIRFVRLLRTHSSERFMMSRGESDIAALEIHYLDDGRVQATFIAFEGMLEESEIPDLLVQIDEVILPDVSLDDKKLIFTVVQGRVVGAFEPTPDPPVTEN